MENQSYLDQKTISNLVKNKNQLSNKDYHLITDINEIDKWIEEAEEVGEVAVDTETNSLDPSSS